MCAHVRDDETNASRPNLVIKWIYPNRLTRSHFGMLEFASSVNSFGSSCTTMPSQQK